MCIRNNLFTMLCAKVHSLNNVRRNIYTCHTPSAQQTRLNQHKQQQFMLRQSPSQDTMSSGGGHLMGNLKRFGSIRLGRSADIPSATLSKQNPMDPVPTAVAGATFSSSSKSSFFAHLSNLSPAKRSPRMYRGISSGTDMSAASSVRDDEMEEELENMLVCWIRSD